MTKSATVIISTTGSAVLSDAIGSVLTQTYRNTSCWVVIDGPQFIDAANIICSRYPSVRVLPLLENTGGSGFYGHRIYAATSFLCNSDYILFLDQDNWMQPTHVGSQIDNCEINNLDWSYSLRRIHDKDGNYLLDDNCESLGKWPIYFGDQHHLVDTSCYCIKKDVAARVGGAWYCGWGGDRQFYATISHHFKNFNTTGLHTLSYRLDGNSNSVNKEFFENGNNIMSQKYNGKFPWMT
jgi:glycosyltransferase involved in cell wall biosynthesis